MVGILERFNQQETSEQQEKSQSRVQILYRSFSQENGKILDECWW